LAQVSREPDLSLGSCALVDRDGEPEVSVVDLLYSVTTGPERRRRLLKPLGLAIAVGLLLLTVLGSRYADRALGLPPLVGDPGGMVVGLVLMVAGGGLWICSVAALKGKGVPFDPPLEVVVTGPYAWLRNPMLVGLCAGLLGLGFALDSVTLVIVGAPAFAALNVLELMLVEEPELERRLGAAYREYRNKVPMFVPGRRRLPSASGSVRVRDPASSVRPVPPRVETRDGRAGPRGRAGP
jgi:protein-S-isoprenylcysteine O-methyltransferase Ste14